MRTLVVVLCAVFACGPGVDSTSDAESGPQQEMAASGEAPSDQGFADACDRAPGWLADDMLRAECRAWLTGHCALRPATDCDASFVTSDRRQLACIVAAVVVAAADGSCAPPELRCLPGLESELYLCNSCGAEEKNLQMMAVGPEGREIAIMDGERCGTSVFLEGATQCQPDEPDCACGCGL